MYLCLFVCLFFDNLSTHSPILFNLCTGLATWSVQTSIVLDYDVTKNSEMGRLFVFVLYVLLVNMVLTDILINCDVRGLCLGLKLQYSVQEQK